MIENEEYIRIYRPDLKTNNCCFLCQNCAGGCSWSRSFEPVDGWKAEKTYFDSYTHEHEEGSYKILFCPEFVEGETTRFDEVDHEGTMNLLERIVSSAAEDFKSAVKQKIKAEREIARGCDRIKAMQAETTIQSCLQTMRSCRFVLGDHCETLYDVAMSEFIEEYE